MTWKIILANGFVLKIVENQILEKQKFGMFTQQKITTNMLVPLGEIKWFGRWRKYAFFPDYMCVFEEECLRDISVFLEQATREHRQK